VQQLQKLIEQLNNPGQQDGVSEWARTVLTADGEALIQLPFSTISS
jgi:hypothetical protein